MWHVALQCYAGADILLTFHLFSYYREVVQNISQLTHTQNLCVISGGVYSSVSNIMFFLILVPIILPIPVDINHVKYYITIVDINTNYVFLSEYPN